MDLLKCKRCGKIISSKGKRFFHFVKCENCSEEYHLSEKGLWMYNLLPFICVIVSVSVSMYVVRSDDIFIKCIIILGGSYCLYYILSLFLIKKGILSYEKKESKKDEQK